MKFCIRSAAMFIVVVLSSPLALSQSLPAGVSPAMLAQLKSMSPAQQRAIAEQYGISLPSGGAGGSEPSTLARPGEPLTSARDQQDLEELLLLLDDEPKGEMEEEDSRQRFGMSLFDGEVSTFAPTDNAPVPDSYRLGVGDQLVVQLFGKENEQLYFGDWALGGYKLP